MSKEMSFQLVIVVLPAVLFLGPQSRALDQFPDAKTTKSISQIETCPEGTQLQITEAYFYSQKAHDFPCGIQCTPTSPDDPSSLCFMDLSHESGNRCRPRFSLQDLNRIYGAVDAGLEELDNIDEEFGDRGEYEIHYVCISVRGNTSADPCRDYLQETGTSPRYTSIVITPEWSSNSQIQPCRTACSLRPDGSLKLSANFLLKHHAANQAVFLEYKFLYTDGTATAWSRLSSSHFSEDNVLNSGVREMKIWFNFTDVSEITRLWLHLQGTEFSIWCEADSQPSVTTATGSPPVEETSIHSKQDNVQMAGTTTVLIYAMSAVAAAAAAAVVGGIAVFLFLRNKRARRASPKPMTRPAPCPHPDSNYTDAYEVLAVDQAQPDTTSGGKAMATGVPGGSGVIDYDTLQHHPGQRSAAGSGSADTYDHAMPQAHDEEYDSLKRGPARLVLVDNANVYDRAGRMGQ